MYVNGTTTTEEQKSTVSKCTFYNIQTDLINDAVIIINMENKS